MHFPVASFFRGLALVSGLKRSKKGSLQGGSGPETPNFGQHKITNCDQVQIRTFKSRNVMVKDAVALFHGKTMGRIHFAYSFIEMCEVTFYHLVKHSHL